MNHKSTLSDIIFDWIFSLPGLITVFVMGVAVGILITI